MPELFKTFDNALADPRPVDQMSRAQAGLIMGLYGFLKDAGLALVCPRCAADGHLALDNDNDPSDEIWKVDCRCRRRRIARMDSQMSPTGWLLLLADDLLTPLSLAVRCPSKACLLKPLRLHQSLDGMRLTVTCHCGGEYKFQKTKKTRLH